MSESATSDALEAIRSALRALRGAEKALKLARESNQDTDTAEHGQPSSPTEPAERALLGYLTDTAATAKSYEEQDPESFRKHFEQRKSQLLDGIISGDMYLENADQGGMVSFDNTDGTKLFEVALKAMCQQGIHQTDLLRTFVDEAHLKNWGDVNTDVDLVIMRYETGDRSTTADLDQVKIASLMEAARHVQGAIDRTRSALADKGIAWAVSDHRTGETATTIAISGVNGKWVATLSSDDILSAVVGLLSVVEVDVDSQQEGWWDAARFDSGLPQQLLPVIRGKEPQVICHRSAIAQIEQWAASIPGWYDDESTPLVMRDAVPDDILQ